MTATKDDWKLIPFTSGVPIPFKGAFSRAEFDKIREGLVSNVMEDKWFIYFEAPYLFLHRSWTGLPVYRVALADNSNGISVEEALCIVEQVERTAPSIRRSCSITSAAICFSPRPSHFPAIEDAA
jgi:hypothetical protein